MKSRLTFIFVIALAIVWLANGCQRNGGGESPTPTPTTTYQAEPTLTPTATPDPNWVPKTSMPADRYHYTSNVVNGKIYVIGGYDDSHQVVQEYDPATDTWASKAPSIKGHAGHASCEAAGKIYVFGGDEGQNWIRDVEEYDPATDTWTLKSPVPSEGEHGIGLLTCSVVNDKIYLLGGLSCQEGPNQTVYVYDPATDSWQTKAPMQIGRYSATSSVVDGIIYVVGGCAAREDNPCLSPIDAVEAYDPATDSWTFKAPMPTARFALTSTVVNGKIYVLGGGVESEMAVVEVYDPATDTWQALRPMLTPAWKFTSNAVGDQIYVIGPGVYQYIPEGE